ncbi:unnamed protein product [Owenia fusiformis]|uniref:Tyrosine-protein kinase n=1 Tax=Owenia fusiformis TaxID=6347 RepID=A0A8J1UFP4_OWEFU|nr:unnamed protein product [Owenia fusiformis]
MAAYMPNNSKFTMAEQDKEVLMTCRANIIENLEVDSVADQLLADKVLSRKMYEDIQAKGRELDKGRTLLDILEKRGPEAFGSFIKALQKDHAFLVDMILETKDGIQTNTVKQGDDTYESAKECISEDIGSLDVLKKSKPTNQVTNENDSTTAESIAISVIKADCKMQNDSSVELKKGDLVVVEEKLSEDALVVDTKTGKKGLIPLSHIIAFGDPKDEPWFYNGKKMSSKEASIMLNRRDHIGCFIVYVSNNPESKSKYNLSVRTDIGVTHYRIFEKTQGLTLGNNKHFTCVKEFVDYYSQSRGGLNRTRLRRPFSLSFPELPAPKWILNSEALKINGDFLGCWRFGSVYSGSYNDTAVAIKAFERQATSENRLDDFMEHVRLMADITVMNDENIIKLIGVCREQKPFYVITELVANESIRERLVNGPTVLKFGYELASALTKLEDMKFVLHRDVALRNCLLSFSGNLKLAGFSRARKVATDQYCSDECGTGDSEIPVRWTAPEVFQSIVNEGGILFTSKNDVWAFGVTLWEMYSKGSLPYDGLSNVEVSERQLEFGTKETPLAKPDKCPENVYAIMTLCWRPHKIRPCMREICGKLKNLMKKSNRPPVPKKPNMPKNSLLGQGVETTL